MSKANNAMNACTQTQTHLLTQLRNICSYMFIYMYVCLYVCLYVYILYMHDICYAVEKKFTYSSKNCAEWILVAI